jgi:hypothetical protein
MDFKEHEKNFFFSKVVVCICNLTNLKSVNYKHFLLQKM